MTQPVPPFRNNWDVRIYYEVYLENEYGIGNFNENDVIIDLGGQAGFFAILAADRGSRRVYTFEPSPENFGHLHKVIDGRQSSIVAENCAVWRSDIECDKIKVCIAENNENTGMTCTIFNQGTEIPTRSLDSILSQFNRVKLLKIDVEGAEFPILLTSQKLDRVDEIVGEVHEIHTTVSLDPSAQVPGYEAYTSGALIDYLRGQGFNVTMTKMAWSDSHYMMRATRI